LSITPAACGSAKAAEIDASSPEIGALALLALVLRLIPRPRSSTFEPVLPIET
jgi:hypothetical protein